MENMKPTSHLDAVELEGSTRSTFLLAQERKRRPSSFRSSDQNAPHSRPTHHSSLLGASRSHSNENMVPVPNNVMKQPPTGVVNIEDDDDDDDDDDDTVEDSPPRSQSSNIRHLLQSSPPPDDDALSPFLQMHEPPYSARRRRTVESLRRRVERVSRTAALTTKQFVWDSNDASIHAALSAVDKWEGAYKAVRVLLVTMVRSAHGLYGTAKQAVIRFEHGLLVPVRNWILLPAFGGIERAALETARFLASEQARRVAQETLEIIKRIPIVGDPVLAPTLQLSVAFVHRFWEIMQYPIPSKQQVRDTVDLCLNGTKWALSSATREVSLYIRRADANITRALSHTQWKVLGSGPYATLDKLSKAVVLDLLCERYLRLPHPVSRYELAAHIRKHNRPLYRDLIRTGLLKDRGGDATANDEWLSPHAPIYRHFSLLLDEDDNEDDPDRVALGPFLMLRPDGDGIRSGWDEYLRQRDTDEYTLAPLWFRLPNVNGKHPGKDAPWIAFRQKEQNQLEDRLQQWLRSDHPPISKDAFQASYNSPHGTNSRNPIATMSPDAKSAPDEDLAVSESSQKTEERHEQQQSKEKCSFNPKTIAKWYFPDLDHDVLVDQRRHAITFVNCCRPSSTDDSNGSPTDGGSVSNRTFENDHDHEDNDLLYPPQFACTMRPTLWRFHGPGDDVRRATWLLDTARHGLQPFDNEAQAILEDAYLFLKYEAFRHQQTKLLAASSRSLHDDEIAEKAVTKTASTFTSTLKENEPEDVLLTVEVLGPDGIDRLVQFSSLTHATAIQKGVGPAMALFKRRVYRGAWLRNPYYSPEKSNGNRVVETVPESEPERLSSPEELEAEPSLDELLRQAAEHSGTLGQTGVPNASLRSIFMPNNESNEIEEDEEIPGTAQVIDYDNTLAVPPSNLYAESMARHLEDLNESKIDHLVLIVHGIGEMLRSIDVFGLWLPNLSSIVECCGRLRRNHVEVQEAHFARMYPSADASSRGSTGRVEYLPVEWHEAFTILSQRRSPDRGSSMKRDKDSSIMMKDISLRTIPTMRDFANDTLMDVLYFMSPEHHDTIIRLVTVEMNVVVTQFRRITGFQGRISVAGHSLGSVISWDILTSEPESGTMLSGARENPENESLVADEYAFDLKHSSGTSQGAQSSLSARPQPCYTRRCPHLGFQVENFFMLGSPVAVFLMIRNQRQPLSETFYLKGCRRVFNIFHPYDPVAYRIEPCIDVRNADFEPIIMKHWNGGFRVQYQTKRLWRKFIETTWKTQQSVVEAFEASMAGMGLLDSAVETSSTDDEAMSESDLGYEENRLHHVVAGLLNQGRRVDYMLQEKEIENANEYVAAFAAHSSYWNEKDLSLFFARQLYLSTLEDAVQVPGEPSCRTFNCLHFSNLMLTPLPRVSRF